MINVRKLNISGVALVALAGTAAATLVLSHEYECDKHINVVNNSYRTITGLYASEAGSDKWDNDFLGWNILPAGYHVRINLDDGSLRCRFDLKVRFGDGTVVIRHNVDVCIVSEYAVKG